MGKKLQPSSQYDKYDINNDGVVSDDEFVLNHFLFYQL